MSGFACMECGRKFRTVRAAEKAASDGCPGCGGVDIDLATTPSYPSNTPTAAELAAMKETK